jgi:hypothetical protein
VYLRTRFRIPQYLFADKGAGIYNNIGLLNASSLTVISSGRWPAPMKETEG